MTDRLRGSHLLRDLNGRIFQAQYDAWRALTATETPAKPHPDTAT